jgi:hypothetical protein
MDHVMNDVATLIREAQRQGARFQVVNGEVQLKPGQISTDVLNQLREHKEEVAKVLTGGTSASSQPCPVNFPPPPVKKALAELRPHLPLALRDLSDLPLLALVQWSIKVAWERAMEKSEL